MGELNQAVEKINELMAEEKRLNKMLNQIQERIKDEIRGQSIKVEKRRIHKMIVLGATIWNEYRKHYQISDDENLRMMEKPDEEFVELAKMIFKEFFENYNAAHAPRDFQRNATITNNLLNI